jgi:hypothetical protein
MGKMREWKSKALYGCQFWEESLTAELISNEFVTRNDDDDPETTIHFMDSHDYDVIGMKKVINKKRVLIGYSTREDIKEQASPRVFQIHELVSERTPLSICLIKFQELDRLFVLGKNTVEGIITTADLYKQPVRILLFSTISILEMLMLKLIRIDFKEEEWKEVIGDRIKEAEELFKLRKNEGEELELLDCLQFCDKAEILISRSENLHKLEFSTQNRARRIFGRLRKIRDCLSHAQDPTSNYKWKEVCEFYAKSLKINERLGA